MKHRLAAALLGIAVSALLASPGPRPLYGQEKAPRQAWTLDEARDQLQLYPRDAYLQYVVLQLARRQGTQAKVAQEIEQMIARETGNGRAGRRDQVDLFSIFTGALAVQESLQLDTMRGGPPRQVRRPVKNGEDPEAQLAQLRKQTVAVADLTGPTIKSHPWVQMLGDKKPDISPLARHVPEDFYFIEFHSMTRMLEIMDLSDLWGTHLSNQATHEARTQKMGDRLKQQLAVETNPLLRPFYDLAVQETAITGSDLFLREGSDVTVLFQIKQPKLFKPRMDSFLTNAETAHKDAKRTNGEYAGIKYVHLTTPDRQVHVFSAYPTPHLHVRSNSRVAFERVLDAIQGKGGRRLGDTAEFAYVRTLMPRGAKEEDGLIYLSDPFIRRLMGPQVKLTEQRRMRCYNHLRMIGHAAQLYRTEHGKAPASLEELAKANCCPGSFNEGDLVCPDGGKYSLSADGTTGVCSHHGSAHFLTPCCEIPVKQVTGVEAHEYKTFLEEYNSYWRTFFDPIAVRIQVTPERYRLETIVLPLIDNSIYTGLAQSLGGKPEALDTLPVPKRNIFSVGLRLNKDGLLKNAMQMERDLKRDVSRTLGLPEEEADKLKVTELLTRGLGNQIGLHIYDAPPMFDLNVPNFLGMTLGSFNGSQRGVGTDEVAISFLIASLNAPVYISVPVNDTKVVDQFLNQLDRLLAIKARHGERGGFIPLSYDFYHLPMKGDKERSARSFGLKFGPIKWRLFWARIGNGLYIASKPFILDDLLALEAQKGKGQDQGPVGHAMVRLRPKNWNEVLADYRLGWAENNREACVNNLGPLSSVGRAYTASLGKVDEAELARVASRIHKEADRLHGVHFFCPEGGRYGLAPDGKTMMCSVHGTALNPRQGNAPSESSSLGKLLNGFGGMTATLTFLEDGLHAVVVLDRK